MSKRIIVGVHITNRVKHVPDVQKALTEYGCNIKTRLGLHEVDRSSCSTIGLLILEMFGEETLIHAMQDKLKAIDGVEVKDMVFAE
jgi:hypothetical protein